MTRSFTSLALAGVLSIVGAAGLSAQEKAATPTVFRISGVLQTAEGDARSGVVVLVASLYGNQTDVTPLWTEAQTVTLDATGRYSILVGSTIEGGVPKSFFLERTGRWVGIAVQGEAEQPNRTLLASVTYADKALDADTLGGKPLSEFVTKKTSSGEPIGNPFNANFVPKYTDGVGNTTNSIMFESGGNRIGILTSTPGAALDVNGDIRAATNLIFAAGAYGMRSNAGIMTFDAGGQFPTGFNFQYGGQSAAALSIASTGNVGIGTASPASKLDVTGNVNVTGNIAASGTVSFAAGAYGMRSNAGILTFDAGGAFPLGFNFQYGNSSSSGIYIAASGNVGVGTSSPASKLDVLGSINVSGNINAKYQDVAEWVDAPAPLEAGTVVVVDRSGVNRVVASTKAYDTGVAGAVSAMPGLVLGEKGDNKEMIAQGGRVKVKVDAKYGAIKIGDILVTSSTPGHAMVSKAIKVGGVYIHRPGTILGKALENWSKGKGEILVLLGSQ